MSQEMSGHENTQVPQSANPEDYSNTIANLEFYLEGVFGKGIFDDEQESQAPAAELEPVSLSQQVSDVPMPLPESTVQSPAVETVKPEGEVFNTAVAPVVVATVQPQPVPMPEPESMAEAVALHGESILDRPATDNRKRHAERRRSAESQWRDIQIPGMKVGSVVQARVQEVRQTPTALEGVTLLLPDGSHRYYNQGWLPGSAAQKQQWLQGLAKGQAVPVEVMSTREEVRRSDGKAHKGAAGRRDVVVSLRSPVERAVFNQLSGGQTVSGMVTKAVSNKEGKLIGWEVALDMLSAWLPANEVDGNLNIGDSVEAVISSLEAVPSKPGVRMWPCFNVRLTVRHAVHVARLFAQERTETAFKALKLGDTIGGVVGPQTVRNADKLHTGWEVMLDNGMPAWVHTSEAGSNLQEGDRVQTMIILLEKRRGVTQSIFTVKVTVARLKEWRLHFKRKVASEPLLGSIQLWQLNGTVGGVTQAVLRVGDTQLIGKVRLFKSNLSNDDMTYEERLKHLEGYVARQEPLPCKVVSFSDKDGALELEWQVGLSKEPQVGDVVAVKVTEVGEDFVNLEVETPQGPATSTITSTGEPVAFVIPSDNG
jgi:exosome complex RNA-binding protein Csl4